QLLDVVAGYVIVRDGIHQHQSLDALGPVKCEMHRDRAAEIDPDDGGLRQSKRGERAVQVVRLRRDAELCVERAVGLAVAEEVDGERGSAGHRERGADVAPHETARAEAVYEKDRRTTMPVAFDVHRSGPNGNSKKIGVHGVRGLSLATGKVR